MIDVTSRRHILRKATAEAHERLDSAVGPLSDHASYVRYLKGLHFFRAGMEAGVRGMEWPPGLTGWRPTMITADLEEDIEDLGAEPLTPRPKPEALDSRGLFGTLYVLEGSSLGARFLLRSAGVLGFDGRFGARHLARQSADHGSWRTFIDLLERADGIEMPALVDAANNAFQSAHNALSKCDR